MGIYIDVEARGNVTEEFMDGLLWWQRRADDFLAIKAVYHASDHEYLDLEEAIGMPIASLVRRHERFYTLVTRPRFGINMVSLLSRVESDYDRRSFSLEGEFKNMGSVIEVFLALCEDAYDDSNGGEFYSEVKYDFDVEPRIRRSINGVII